MCDAMIFAAFFCEYMAEVNKINFYYHPQTKLREGNVFTPVCDSVHRGRGCIPACIGQRGLYPSMQWGVCLGVFAWGGVSALGVSAQGGVCPDAETDTLPMTQKQTPPPDDH